ncbi:hypothetical protein UFOVP501_1 [uncultured Caudovirales phage]|uniref:Gene product 88 domain-containing protein n=1 Tax=uncultured Caudovirales phage TaxID=2100421 RepID=A0A6J5MHZ7_9CAUD|nr:hypothetical protein UFOVP501_1 [uncultured Caudovirales phage]CAB4161414.1 hypothetical protein UFOVP762_50 [uncultured Caudovirales phage]CAB4187132.1 hypothetical protein UFOVP1161_1 [uncultured Caudovirales phage]
MQLFSISTNAKTVKGEKLGYLTGVLYLAPAKLSGYQVCAMAAVAQCEEACLNKAGLGGVYTSIQKARIAKTRRFFEDRDAFMSDIVKSVRGLIRLSRKQRRDSKGRFAKRFQVLIRLNGTSDIRWELIPVTIDGITYANLMLAFPDIQFYDYTKLANRKNLPENYDLTFSYSGVKQYQPQVAKAQKALMRIAVVFRHVESIPKRFIGLKCIGGDNSDVRHIEQQNVVVALYAKGPAKHDQTGFVVG